MTIADLVEDSWQVAEDHGFHSGRTNTRDDTIVRLCLIHSEVSEAVQEVKRHGVDSPEVLSDLSMELADILIRVGDLCGCLGLNLEGAVKTKMDANRLRPKFYGTPFQEKGKCGV